MFQFCSTLMYVGMPCHAIPNQCKNTSGLSRNEDGQRERRGIREKFEGKTESDCIQKKGKVAEVYPLICPEYLKLLYPCL